MKTNAGEMDRILRIIVGIIIIATGMTYQAMIIPIGMIILITGIIGWCPFYQFFDVSTTSIEEQIQN